MDFFLKFSFFEIVYFNFFWNFIIMKFSQSTQTRLNEKSESPRAIGQFEECWNGQDENVGGALTGERETCQTAQAE